MNRDCCQETDQNLKSDSRSMLESQAPFVTMAQKNLVPQLGDNNFKTSHIERIQQITSMDQTIYKEPTSQITKPKKGNKLDDEGEGEDEENRFLTTYDETYLPPMNFFMPSMISNPTLRVVPNLTDFV